MEVGVNAEPLGLVLQEDDRRRHVDLGVLNNLLHDKGADERLAALAVPVVRLALANLLSVQIRDSQGLWLLVTQLTHQLGPDFWLHSVGKSLLNTADDRLL